MAPVTVETFSTLAETTTTADPGSGGTSLALTSRTAFPQSGQFRILVQDSETDKTNREIMLVTAGFGTGAGSFTVTRGVEGTSGVAHASGSYVAQIYTAEAIRRFVPDHVWQPRHHNMLAWSEDVARATSTSGSPVTSTLYLVKVYLPETITVTNILFRVVGLAATLTSSDAAIFDGSGGVNAATAAGDRIAVTASLNAIINSAGFKTVALTADASRSLTLIGGPGKWIYLAIRQTATTRATFAYPGQSGSQNDGLAAADGFRTASLAGASMPTSITISALTASGIFAWMGLS